MKIDFQHTANKYIKNGDTVVDIGSNVGNCTSVLSSIVGRKGRVFAFEPNIFTFQVLKNEADKKEYNNIVFENKAVMDFDGRTKLYLYDKNINDQRYIHTYNTERSIDFMESDCVTIDSYFKNYNKEISFINIDMQGGELPVLKGAIDLIKRQERIVLFMSFLNSGMKNGKECLGLLVDLGFKLMERDKLAGKIIKIDDLDIFLRSYPMEGKIRSNLAHLICIKE